MSNKSLDRAMVREIHQSDSKGAGWRGEGSRKGGSVDKNPANTSGLSMSGGSMGLGKAVKHLKKQHSC